MSNAGWTIAHNEVIILYLDAANTLRASIDIVHICKVDPADPLSPLLPYKLKTDRREQTAQRIVDDMLYDHLELAALMDSHYTRSFQAHAKRRKWSG